MTTLASAFVILLGSTAFVSAHAETLKRLPFADGRYVTNQKLCALSASKMVEKFGDRVSTMVINIHGLKLDNGYELFCQTRKIRLQGKSLKFEVVCESEGQLEVSSENWTVLDKQRFKVNGQTYKACGKLIE